MSENYQETLVNGTSWKRASRVIINNPLNALPSIIFMEDEVIMIENKTIITPVATLEATYEPDNVLHMELYNKLNELYVILREIRDNS